MSKLSSLNISWLQSSTLQGVFLLWALIFSAAPVHAAGPYQVIVEGVEGAVRHNVEAVLAIPNGLVIAGRVEPVWARRFARQAQGRAQRALEPFGYYSPEIKTDLVTGDDASYRLRVTISPGEPVRVSQRSIRLSGPGADVPQLRQRVEAFPLEPDMPMRHDLYEDAKGLLLATAFDLGFLEARFSVHEVRLNRENRQATIDLELETGPQFFFGDVTFTGADGFPEATLRRYLAFAPGEPFSEDRLSRSQSNLLDADTFRSVKVEPDRSRVEGQRIPVQVDLVAMPHYQLRPGLGYGTDTGARMSLRFRNINAFHLGHELHSDLLYAELHQDLSGRYLVPLAGHLDSLMSFSLQYNRNLYDAFEASTLAAEASLTRGFARGYKATAYLNLSTETYQVGEDQTRQTTLVMPGLRIGQRLWSFDRPGRPQKGYSWQLEARGSSTTLGSDVSLLQGLVSSSTIIPLPRQTQLILRAEGGATLQNEFSDLPASMRFFAGGDQSVRGYAYKSLGPKDSNGDVIGGRHMAVGSIEGDKRLGDDWSLALFYDSGNAFNDLSHFELQHGAGFGVRRHTPVGPVKLDLARQLGGSNNYRIHLSVGFVW